jgi:hypothetical protein
VVSTARVFLRPVLGQHRPDARREKTQKNTFSLSHRAVYCMLDKHDMAGEGRSEGLLGYSFSMWTFCFLKNDATIARE